MRRMWTGLAAALLLTGTAVAVAESAAATVVFAHDFEDGGSAGWQLTGGRWGVSTDGSRVLRQSRSGATSARATAGEAGWAGYTLSARVKPTSLSGPWAAAGIVARSTTSGGYTLALRPGDRVELARVAAGRRTVLATATLPVRTGRWYDLSLRVEGDRLQATVGAATLTATDATFAAGAVALFTERAAASFDDVTVDTVQDTRAPSLPGRPELLEVTPTTATITWPASTDDTGVTGYLIYFGGQFYEDHFLRQVATNAPVTLSIGGNTGASYHFSVRAVDAAGNMSGFGPRVSFPHPPTVPRVPGDTVPPTAPGVPVVTGTASGTLVSWAPATDDTGIVEYHVVHSFNVDEVRVRAIVPGGVTSATVSSPGTMPNQVWVVAYDAAWNATRGPSATLIPSTPPPTPPPTASPS
ncbi:hypothetical protein ACTMTJ_28690 [Phytohabitans sp. LJ34]|uniref:hypothetical protein n=1 Tax=Phytohabitans sp. LJ34 TaxID=3452217 RepID=UPI003F89A25B